MTSIPEWQTVVYEEFSRLVGKVLTKIESVFPDKTQREAFKNIVEQDVYDSRNNICKRIAELRDNETEVKERDK